MSRFRLLHLSDLHIAEEADHLNRHEKMREALNSGFTDVWRSENLSSDLMSLLRPTSHSTFAQHMAAKFCYDRRDDVDAIVITGDIATTGRDKDLAAAREYVLKNVKSHYFDWRFGSSLSAGGRRIYLMPGNHDRYKGFLPNPSVNNLNFENYFPNHYPLGKRVHSFTRSKEGRSIGVVFGDFCIRSDADVSSGSAWGKGIAYEDILDDMAAESRRLRLERPGILILWAIHFAPFECGASLELVDGAAVIDRARRSGVRHILCGHTHTKERISIGDVTVYCAGSACSVDREGSHMVHIVDIQYDAASAAVTRENFVLRRNAGGFEHDSYD